MFILFLDNEKNRYSIIKNGVVVDISQVDSLPHDNHDLTSFRINVDDYDEAFEFFKAHGFTTPMILMQI